MSKPDGTMPNRPRGQPVWPGLIGATAAVSVGILLGRLLGFVREAVLAAKLGVTGDADAAVLVLTLPDLLTNILIGGAMAAVLIPEFQKEARERGQDVKSGLFMGASLVTLVCFGAVAALLAVNAGLLLTLLGPGLAETHKTAEDQLRVVVWALPLAGLTTVTAAYLQARHRFFVPALGTALFNIVIICVLVGWVAPGNIEALGAGVLLAALARWVSQLAQIRAESPKNMRHWGSSPLTSALARRYLQALGAGIAILAVPAVARALASVHGSGSMAMMNYSTKLVELPLGTAVTALSVALYPSLNQAFSLGDRASGVRLARQGLLATWALAVPLAMVLGGLSTGWAGIVYGRGAITPEAVAETGQLTFIGAFSLPVHGALDFLVAVFNALGDF